MAFKSSNIRCEVVKSSRANFRDGRTERLFRFLQYNWIIFPASVLFIFLCITGPFYRFTRWAGYIDHERTWTALASAFAVFVAPNRIYHFVNTICSFWPYNPYQLRVQQKKWKFDRLLVCVVSLGLNEDSVRRTVSALINAKGIDSRIEIHLVLPAENVGPFLDLVETNMVKITSVPAHFPAAVKAKFKARSLEYFRYVEISGKDDWVLHLDEETVVDQHCLQTCLDFIERRERENMKIAQGMIFYNAFNYWKNWLYTTADLVRVADDFGRFQFQYNANRCPWGGIHGSFLLVNGEVEHSVSWDTDILAEDFWFGKEAWAQGYEFGWLPSIAREQSPMTLMDYLKQRRRWHVGCWQLNILYVRFFVIMWSWSPMQMFFILFWKLSANPVLPYWLYLVLAMDYSFQLHTFLWTSMIQNWDSGMSFWRMVIAPVKILIMFPIVGMLDMITCLYCLFTKVNGFDVIKK